MLGGICLQRVYFNKWWSLGPVPDDLSKDFPQIKEITLHLDNDTAGRLAAETIKTLLSSSCIVSDKPPNRGKDMNDYLKISLGLQHSRELERL